MALSKNQTVPLYAREPLACEARTITEDWLLIRVASKLNLCKLRDFAKLLGIKDDETYQECVQLAEEKCQELSITASTCGAINIRKKKLNFEVILVDCQYICQANFRPSLTKYKKL